MIRSPITRRRLRENGTGRAGLTHFFHRPTVSGRRWRQQQSSSNFQRAAPPAAVAFRPAAWLRRPNNNGMWSRRRKWPRDATGRWRYLYTFRHSAAARGHKHLLCVCVCPWTERGRHGRQKTRGERCAGAGRETINFGSFPRNGGACSVTLWPLARSRTPPPNRPESDDAHLGVGGPILFFKNGASTFQGLTPTTALPLLLSFQSDPPTQTRKINDVVSRGEIQYNYVKKKCKI